MTDNTSYQHVSILWATPEYAPELARLHACIFTKAWDAESFGRLLTHPGSTSFIARVGKVPEAVGFILSQIAADEAEILTLGVHKDKQRHGIGGRLVEAIIRAARKAEVRRLFLEVGNRNTPALALYAKLGFRQTGVRKGYYEHAGDHPEDALILALDL